MSAIDFQLPEIVWPAQRPVIDPAAPKSYEALKPQGEPQMPVAGVPPQLVPRDDDLGDPSAPSPVVDPVAPVVPDTVKSVTGETVKAESSGWMKELKQAARGGEISKAYEKSLLSAVPTAIAGVNSEIQMVKIANTVGLGEVDRMNYTALEPTLRIVLGNPDKTQRDAARQRIKAAVPNMLGLPEGVRGTSLDFIDRAFDDPTFLDRMTARSKYRYSPFTDPVLQVAIEMQDNIDRKYNIDPSFVGSWAEKIAGTAGSLSSFILARKAGGSVGLDAFAVYSGQGEAYQRALQAGASPEVAFKAASLGGLIGATDVLPVERLVASPKVTRALFALAISAGKQAIIEGGQEAFQTYMGNVIAKVLYKPGQDVSQDVWESAALGAIAGAGADVVTGGFREEMAATRPTQGSDFKGPTSDAVPPEPTAGSQGKPQEAVSAPAGTETPASTENAAGEAAAKPDAPSVPASFPAPLKVGEITVLPPDQRAVESDYLMASDIGLLEPIQKEIAAGTAVEDIRAKIEPLLLPVKEYMARQGLTDPEQVKVELDGMVQNIVKRLQQTSASIAPGEQANDNSNIIRIADVRAEKALQEFRDEFMGDVQSRAQEMARITQLGIDNGVFDNVQVGDRFFTPKGGVMKVDGFALREVKPQNRQQRERHYAAVNAGKPLYVEVGGKLYEPLLRTTTQHANGDTSTSDSVYGILKNLNYRKATGPQAVDTGDISSARRPNDTDTGPRDRTGSNGSGSIAPLDGAPQVSGGGPNAELVAVAELYSADAGIEFRRQAEYVEVDVARATRIAQAYAEMPHAPQDPKVKEAYDDLIKQTTAQYKALSDAGFTFYFFDETNDPYQGNPWNAVRDLKENRRMAVFASEAGFGSGDTEINVEDNPLLADTGIKWPWGSPDGPEKRVLANDLFRAVHDAFGHGLEGSGFRARGDENAWQAHSRLFYGPALGAMTTETRGQNSWLNFGPHGENNRNAPTEDTIFADQKTGLMPEWTWTEGKAADMDVSAAVTPDQTQTPEFKAWFGDSKVVDAEGNPLVVYHGTNKSFKKIDMDKGAMGTFWFTSDRAAIEAGEVGASGKGVIMSLYAKIDNPAGWTEYDKFSKGELIGRGFDGVILPEKDGSFTGFIFEPNQVKSATANTGSFDPSNPDITRAAPPQTKGIRHAYIHERIRPASGIKHQEMINGQSVVDIAQNFKKALGLTVQVGRFDRGHSQSEGIFKWQQSVARVKTESDLTTLFHEGGHHLHQMMGKPLDDLIKKHYAELEKLALNFYGGGGQINPKDKTLVMREGFAHFFQTFVNNPLVASAIAPQFAQEFGPLLDQHQPGVRAALGEVIKAVDTHVSTKSSLQIALEHVSTGEKPGFIGKMVSAARDGNLMHEIGALVERWYMSIVAGDYPLVKLVNQLAGIAENNYRVLHERGEITAAQLNAALDSLSRVGKRNPVKMYWAAKNSGMIAAEFLHSGVRKFNSQDNAPVSKGMKQIMAELVGDLRGHLYDELVHSFDAYLMARRVRSERQNYKMTMAWIANGKQGNPPAVIRMQDPDSAFSEGDTNQAIVDLEKQYPQFERAAKDIYQFLRAMVEYRRDAGDFTVDEADYMLAFEDYVPLHRVMDEGRRFTGSGDSVTGKNNGIKQFKGSGRQVISPLRSIVQMTHQQMAVSMTNEMKRSIVNMALDIGQGTGALIERVPDTAMKGTRVNLSEVLKAAGHIDLSSLGVEVQGTDINDLRELADELMSGDEVATIWRPGDINEKGEHIIYVWRNGKREAYKLNDVEWADDLYQTLTDLAPPQRSMLIHILSAPARALRWGIVTEPIYQLANIIRDGFQTMVLEPGTVPFQIVGKGLKNHLYNAQIKQLYNLSGTTIAGREIEKLDKRKYGIERGNLQKMGINLQDVPIAGGIAEVVRTYYSSEALSRQGLFARAYERALKDGLAPHDALIEAGYTATDYANYGRGGSRMAELRAVVPFLGAAIQGLDKTIRASTGGGAMPAVVRKKLAPWINRTMKLEGTKTSLPLTKAEAESFKYAMKVQGAMMLMGVASMLLDSMYWGDEEYEQFSPYLRGTRWMVKVGPGQWLGIPKPFQYAFYTTLFSYGLDAAYKGDTTAMMKFLESQLYVTMVPYENPGIALGYELAANRDMFSGRDIVPPNLAARPWRMQADIYTSELGKRLGQLTGLSPIVIDHVITSSFATWGRSAMAMSNLTDPTRPQQGAEDFAFSRYFIKNGSRSTTVKPAFWNLVGRSTGALTGSYDAFRDLMDAGATGQAMQYLSGATDDEKAYSYLNYYQKPEAKKLHPLRNANDMVTAISSLRKEITANNFRLDGGDGDRVILSPTIQRQLNDRLSVLGIREMRNALIITDQPGFGGKVVMPTLSIYKEIEAIDGRVARELKDRLGNKVYAFDTVRRLWPQVKTELLINGEKAQLTPFVSQARAGGKKYFTEGDGP